MPHDHSHDHHDEDHQDDHHHGHHDNDEVAGEDPHDHDHSHHDPSSKNEQSPLLLAPPRTAREEKDARRRQSVLNRLYIATFLCSCFIVVEIIGGLWAHSLAILSDAAHLFADLASFAVAIAASYLASLPATRHHTFGLRRTESLAALFSMLSLALVSVGLGYEAMVRLISPPDELVQGKIMSGIASIGVLVNIALAFVLGENHVHLPGMDHDGHDHSHDHDHGHHGGCSSDHHPHDDDDDDDYHSCGSHDHHHHDHDKDHHHSYGSTTDTSRSSSNHHPKGQQEDDVEKGMTAQGHDHHHDDHHHGHVHDHESAKEEEDHHDHHHAPCLELLHNDEVVPLVDDCGAGATGGHDAIDPHEQEERNINLHAAYLHVMGDLAQSVAVLIAGLVIWVRPDWHFVDPILTLLFACLVLYSTVGVLRVSMTVLLEGTPPNVSWQKVYEAICLVPNVQDVHDLHIWSIAHGLPTLSVHCQSDDPMALHNIRDACRKFGISHATIQIQPISGSSCVTCGDISSCTRHFDDHRI